MYRLFLIVQIFMLLVLVFSVGSVNAQSSSIQNGSPASFEGVYNIMIDEGYTEDERSVTQSEVYGIVHREGMADVYLQDLLPGASPGDRVQVTGRLEDAVDLEKTRLQVDHYNVIAKSANKSKTEGPIRVAVILFNYRNHTMQHTTKSRDGFNVFWSS